MSTPDERARDKDRDAAVDLVDAALARGRIVQADRDKRVEEIKRAQTLQEIDLHVRDLRAADGSAAWAPDAAAAAAAGAAATITVSPAGDVSVTPAPGGSGDAGAGGGFQVQYGGSGADTPDLTTAVTVGSKAPKAIGIIVMVVVVGVVASVVIGIVAVVGAVRGTVDSVTDVLDDPATAIPSTTPLPGQTPDVGVNLFTTGGYDDFVAGVELASGATTAFEAVLYPTYAVAYLPVDGSTQRQSMWYWNGTIDDLDSRGTSSYERFDLADIDPEVVIALVKKVRRHVEDPTSFYAILRAPDSDGASIWAYASNEYYETAYLGATADGKVVYDSTKVG